MLHDNGHTDSTSTRLLFLLLCLQRFVHDTKNFPQDKAFDTRIIILTRISQCPRGFLFTCWDKLFVYSRNARKRMKRSEYSAVDDDSSFLSSFNYILKSNEFVWKFTVFINNDIRVRFWTVFQNFVRRGLRGFSTIEAPHVRVSIFQRTRWKQSLGTIEKLFKTSTLTGGLALAFHLVSRSQFIRISHWNLELKSPLSFRVWTTREKVSPCLTVFFD